MCEYHLAPLTPQALIFRSNQSNHDFHIPIRTLAAMVYGNLWLIRRVNDWSRESEHGCWKCGSLRMNIIQCSKGNHTLILGSFTINWNRNLKPTLTRGGHHDACTSTPLFLPFAQSWDGYTVLAELHEGFVWTAVSSQLIALCS